ncbi:glycosyl hydrolase family 28-related protein [Cupriavidus sp. 30B13]|uniref:glycosyl hydrolase family 28-related protein n=1 Tax=Cupriavidus sp. 30B13 TaxID=3384241 RepID=UPI003B91016C
MTISSTTRKAGPYFGDGVTTLFPFAYKVFKKQDVLVTFTNAIGIDGVLVLDSDYTVTLNPDQDNNPGGTVQYPRTGSPLAVMAPGERLTLTGALPETQPTDIPNLSPFFPQVVEDGLDRATILIQQLQEQSDRAIKISVSDTPLNPLPAAAARANEVIGFDAMGNLVLYPIPASLGAGDMRVDVFTAGADFVPGLTTQLALSRAPGTPANAEVFFDSSFQGPDQWSVAGNLLTFSGAIPVGVSKVFVRLGTTLSTQIPPDGSIVDASVAQGTKLYNRITDIVDVKDFGAVGNGVSDDHAAFAAAELTGKPYTVPAGIFRIGSSITLAGKVTFMPGAVLKPDAGVTVTFAQNFVAASSYQIFDLSNANALISLPYNMTEAWGEWWGAKGDAVKTNNEVPIQQALTAVGATATGGTGVANGRVRLGRGWFLLSGGINIPNYVSLVGNQKGYTVLKANPATWSGNLMFNATNGGQPMFDSRIENMRISASNITAITYFVYSTAWQESCGLRNVLMLDFMNSGLYYEVGDGGAAVLMVEDCEIFPANASTGSNGIFITNDFTQAWMNLHLVRTTIGTGAASPTNISGVKASGRVNVVCDALHFEGVTNGFVLSTAASVNGAGVNGGANMAAVFNIAGGWTGSLAITGCRLGAANAMIVDTARPYIFAASEPQDGRVTWPLDGSRPFAVGYVQGGATPAFVFQRGMLVGSPFSSLTRTGTGIYRLQLAASMDSATSYYVVLTSMDPNTPMINCDPQTATVFNVDTRNASAALTDSAGFMVAVYHNP